MSSTNTLSVRELIPSALAGIAISVGIGIILFKTGLVDYSLYVNVAIILISAVLTGAIVIKYNPRTHQASITGTHTLSFFVVTLIQIAFAESIKNQLGLEYS